MTWMRRKDKDDLPVSKARRKASKLDTPNLKLWAESLSMSSQHYINDYNVNGDDIALHEAYELSACQVDVLAELIERLKVVS